MFKTIGAKIKLVLGVIAGIFGFFLFFFVRQQIRAKEKVQYDLEKVTSEIELAKLETDSKERKKKIESLKEQEYLIREKIDYIEKVETIEKREVSIEELDAFFDKRGF